MPAPSPRVLLGLGLAAVVVGIAGHLAAQWLFFPNDSNGFASVAQQRLRTAVLYVGSGLVAGSFVVAALSPRPPGPGRPPTG